MILAITATVQATYLPTLGATYSAVHSTQLMFSDYTGPLFQIRNAGNAQTLNISAASGSVLPDDSVISDFVTS